MVVVFETLESCTTHLRGNKRDSSIQQLYILCEADIQYMFFCNQDMRLSFWFLSIHPAQN